jgi:hypothetical protein
MGYGSGPLSEELTPKDREILSKMYAGLEQAITGPARRAVVQKILEQFGPTQAKSIEKTLKHLHGMSKFERFRTSAIFLLAAIYQAGINFALETEGVALVDKVRLTNLMVGVADSASKEGAEGALKAMKPALMRKVAKSK